MRADGESQRIYAALVRHHTPRTPVLRNALLAFGVGGGICALAQIVYGRLQRGGLSPDQAGTYTALAVVVVGAVLTGLGVYDEVVRMGGMGGSLPISGFANSIVSPAMEFRREGWVLGVGAKIFTVAGPVIVYGLLTALVVAAIRLLALGGLALPHPLR